MSDSPPPIIDTHAHLDDVAFDADRGEVLARGRAAGVRSFLNIAYRADIWEQSVRLRDAHQDVELVAGIHPQDAATFNSAESDVLSERLLELRPLAVGEAGYDFARPGPSYRQQQSVFQWQIQLAISSDLPLVIHQRDASEQLTKELDQWPNLRRVVLHSFDGDERLARWARERSFFVGIGGLACRKSSGVLRQVLQLIPVDKLLLETDSPYLAPPGVSSRRNEPENLPVMAATLAPLWDLSTEELSRQTTGNAISVFRMTFRG